MGRFGIKRRRNYTFLFLGTANHILAKEVGMIPYYFYKMFRFNGKVLTYKLGEYPYLENICKGLELDFVAKKGTFYNGINLNCERSVIKYLFKNAKNIDILNLLHFNDQNVRFGVLYKILNRNGFLYLKLDSNIKVSKQQLSYYKTKHRYKGFLDFFNYNFVKILYGLFSKKIDLISAETKKLTNFLQTNYKFLKDKTIYIPNGIDNYYLEESNIKVKPFSEKKNIILYVGRIGFKEKSVETLLEAIPKINNLKDWKIVLVGPIINNFDKYISEYFKKYHNLKNKIKFTGEIADKKILFDHYYNRSKIFCLTSLNESFGFVLIEAAYFGNYIVCTDFTSVREITLNSTLGTIFKQRDSDELALILENLINDEAKLKQNYQKIISHVKKNYSWSKIIKRLYYEINKRK